jgi:hypothetical protein
VAPVLNEFIVVEAFVDFDYSSNVGQCPGIWREAELSTVDFRPMRSSNPAAGDPRSNRR